MQWNLTGLCGAIWAEELINVWRPAGVICTFVDVLNSTYCVSYCAKDRAKVHLADEAATDKGLTGHFPQSCVRARLSSTSFPSRSHWWSHLVQVAWMFTGVTVIGIVSSASPAHLVHPSHAHNGWITSIHPFPLPALTWWTTGGKHNLPLQAFPPQMQANFMKKGGVSGPCAILQLPSGCHLLPRCKTPSTSDLFLSGWLLHHPSPCQIERRAWEIHRDGAIGAGLHRLRWHALKMDFVLYLLGQEIRCCRRWCILRAKLNVFRLVLHEKNVYGCWGLSSELFYPLFRSPWDVPWLSLSSGKEKSSAFIVNNSVWIYYRL